MAENIPNISFIVSQLPNKLQKRFESLGSYVRGLIDEESSRLDKKIVLSTEDIQLIQLAALIYSLDSFFRAGSSSARGAAIIFEEFDLSGFRVGTTTFTRENINTRRGDLLANKLRESIINSALGMAITNANSMRALISTMIRGMSND